MARKVDNEGIKIVASNRRARHEYEILETWEAGLVLQGTEVKALREGHVNLGDAYGEIRDGEGWVVKMHIGPYEQGNRENHEPFRPRKLLLHRREIRKMLPKLEEKGLTLVPLRLYFREGRAKLELGLGRGKKLHDKRESKAKQDVQRRIAQHMGRREP
ncbi:MAG: SsrA-binding protein SmpB [bacterium]|jgi:SsrA-binding protein|nr:SsrA-binding protein SmpB [bacterium]MBK7045505.1 SsrA-binding protein SmpB [bacterium]MBK7187561.1 SsrA-binding protein SmpB [bacterium]MBK7672018.1 SsrA-binding protein SmpB [bacterium]MBK7769276.1 SsrA-binding protein SmpB [bacterium]